jgi:uncharacterized linocin/CFP29 family protein
MNQYVAELGWTDEQWGRVCRAVSEEAQRTRVAAKFLPVYGPVDASEVAVARLRFKEINDPLAGSGGPKKRLSVDSDPTTELSRISCLVHLKSHEAADPELQAALTMFRRAASIIARTEDALMFNGIDKGKSATPPLAPSSGVLKISGANEARGLLPETIALAKTVGVSVTVDSPVGNRSSVADAGTALVSRVVRAIDKLDDEGYSPPYACVLARDLYQAVHSPTPNLVLPRHTILPILEGGPLLGSGRIKQGWGVIVAYESHQVEQVLASDISVKFLQVSQEPRFVFRVSERVALRIRDRKAFAVLHPEG